MRPKDLRDATLDELDALFEEGKVPEGDEVRGGMCGEVLAGRGPARTSGWRRLSRLLPWAGMYLGDDRGAEGEDGINHLGYPPVVVERYGFRTYVEDRNGDRALVLDYDVRGNPYLLRRLKERVRRVDGGLLLGRAYVSVGGRRFFLHYYAMEPTESEIPVG